MINLSGTIVTARDKAHNYLLDNDVDLKYDIIYHCGPIIKKIDDHFQIISAGPTTSARMNKYEAEIIRKYNIKAIIGKGGMDQKTHDALIKNKGVYFVAFGGCGVLMRESIVKVVEVKKQEFGMPEAMWVLEVKNMPLFVGMDTHGNNIFKKVLDKSKQIKNKLL